MHVKIDDHSKSEKIKIERGVRQGDTLSSKLLILALEDVFKKLDWDKFRINIDCR